MPWRMRSPWPTPICRGSHARRSKAMTAASCWAGSGGLAVACLQGRVHLYEGVPASAVNVLVRTLKALGCEILVLTNAAGSLRPEVGAGSGRADRRPHQPARPEPAGRRQRRCDRAALSRPLRGLRSALREQLARIAEASASSSRAASISRSRGRASRLRPRSARSGRSAPIWSACRPCPRRSARGMPACAWSGCRS